MKLTLLLDLDDTLLQNSMDKFVPAYLMALSQHLANVVAPDQLIQHLMRATQIMLSNDRPDQTLKETFDQAFYPAIGVIEQQVYDQIEQFYRDVFPQLQYLTQPMPGVEEFVQEAIKRGYDLLIATNPLFPRQAVLQRLGWAGLSHQIASFQFIPSYETLHFAKPNPAYFAELLARTGWQDQPAVMVGDDLHNDIYPARKAGLHTYWVTKDNTESLQDWGDLKQIMEWIDQTEAEKLQIDFSTPESILAVLKATPAALPFLCNQLDPNDWNTRFQAGEWCQTEVLCHLRDVEMEVNLPRIQKSIQEDNPFIPGIETDQWAEQRQYCLQSGQGALATFIQSRISLIDQLAALPPDAWLRQIRHAIFGPTTLLELVGFIAAHDRIHIHQIYQNQLFAKKK
jgi:HAD superfamily hydrolase (TIGR01549 family)